MAVLILMLPLALSAEPVWSGNASVDSGEFVNFIEDTPLAGASSSFTRNTVIEVTNSQNGRTVEVTIVKRAPRPGVFLVLSGPAGDVLDFPADQVVPVQVRVVSDTETSAYENRFESSDPDINPAVTLPEETDEAGALVPPDTSAKVDTAAVGEGSGIETVESEPAEADFLDGPVPVPLPEEPEEMLAVVDTEDTAVISGETAPVVTEGSAEISEAAEETAPVEIVEEVIESAEPVLIPGAAETAIEEPILPLEEEPVAEVLPVEVPEESEETVLPAETVEETAPVAELPPEEFIPEDADNDNVIYFLTPSDFRPPVAPEAEEEIVPVYVERDVLEDRIEDQLNNGSSYIQLGAYSSSAIVYGEMESIATRYPMIVWTEETEDGTIYKLLIGPLTPDETGVLVYRFRSRGYGDLFLYRP